MAPGYRALHDEPATQADRWGDGSGTADTTGLISETAVAARRQRYTGRQVAHFCRTAAARWGWTDDRRSWEHRSRSVRPLLYDTALAHDTERRNDAERTLETDGLDGQMQTVRGAEEGRNEENR